jgi:hypothetical protein
VAPAWRPTAGSKLTAGQPAEQISYVDRDGRIRLVDADTRQPVAGISLWPFPAEQHGRVLELGWAASGERLVSRSAQALMADDVVAGGEAGAFAYVAAGRAELENAAIAPSGDEVAVVERKSGVSTIRRFALDRGERSPDGPIFAGPGALAGLIWSPDGRWLATGWRDADQWLFIRSDRPHRLVAFDDVSSEFGNGSFPRLADWALPQR